MDVARIVSSVPTLCWDILGDAKERCWSTCLGLTNTSLCSTSLVQDPQHSRADTLLCCLWYDTGHGTLLSHAVTRVPFRSTAFTSQSAHVNYCLLSNKSNKFHLLFKANRSDKRVLISSIINADECLPSAWLSLFHVQVAFLFFFF